MNCRAGRALIAATLAATACVGAPPEEAFDLSLGTLSLNADAVNQTWPSAQPYQWGDPALTIFRARLHLAGGTFEAPTHVFGEPVRLWAYGTEAAESGLSTLFPPDDVGFAIRTRRPALRDLDESLPLAAWADELIDAQDTHVALVVGVQSEQRPSVVTVNVPQAYLEGGFGGPEQAVVLLRPVFPPAIDQMPALRQAFVDNLRTMAVALGTVVAFDAGGPLEALPAPTWVAMMIRAVAGERAGVEFFLASEHTLDDATFCELVTTAAMAVPLNEATVMPLLTQSGLSADDAVRTWSSFTNRLGSLAEGHPNESIGRIRLTLAPPDLRPIGATVADGSVGAGLALPPVAAADLVEHIVFDVLPRESLGESIAPLQASVLHQLAPVIVERLYGRAPADRSLWQPAIDQVFSWVVDVVGTQYPTTAEFRAALAGPLQSLRTVTPVDDRISVVPRATFRAIARGSKPAGWIGLQVVGHAVHVDLVTAD